MKITFAYRIGYVPNNRYVRTFEAESVLDWFVQNWLVLSPPSDSDENRAAIEELLGEWPYGFPICDYDDVKDGTIAELIPAPRNLEELKEKLEEFIYCSEVLTSKSCVQVLTDDDEIELAWYVFDEEYAQQNAARVSVWLHPDLPLQAADSASEEPLKSKTILPAGTRSGSVYWMSSVIADSSHLSDMLEGAYRIEGVRLPELLNHLRDSNTFGARSNAPYELRLVQQLCKLFSEHNPQQVFEMWAQFSSARLKDVASEAISDLTAEDVRQRRDTSSGESRVLCSEHLVEVMAHDGFKYDYLIIFDDLWLAANPNLAQSLSRFCSTWKI